LLVNHVHDQLRAQHQAPPKQVKRKWQIFNWTTVLVSGSIVGIVALAFMYFKKEKQLILEKERRRALGKSAIGGKFSLTDHNGKTVTSDDLLGKWLLIYFGFTHCPDICPDEIEKMVKAVDIIESQNPSEVIQPVFITVDAERDSPAIVGQYIKEFSNKLIGLTGTQEQIHEATRAYRVYYSAGPRDKTNDYIVDHTIIMYLINPDGEFVDYYGQTKTEDNIATGVGIAMVKYNQLKKQKNKFSLL